MAGNLTRRVTKKREERKFFSLCMPPGGVIYLVLCACNAYFATLGSV